MPSINCSYAGEWGFFNFQVLGRVQRYLEKNPDTVFNIVTYPDYFEILNIMFPNNFKLLSPINNHSDKGRIAHRSKIIIPETNIIPIISNKEELRVLPGFDRNVPGISLVNNLKTPITIKDANIKEPDPGSIIVSLCCRKRINASWRNLSKKQWGLIIEILRDFWPDCKLVFHGLPSETHNPKTFIKGNFHVCKDIREAIFFLNRSAICISAVSGYTQFASNCNCNILEIGKGKGKHNPKHNSPWHIPRNKFGLINYNPFKKIKRFLHIRNIGTLPNLLSKCKSPTAVLE